MLKVEIFIKKPLMAKSSIKLKMLKAIILVLVKPLNSSDKSFMLVEAI